MSVEALNLARRPFANSRPVARVAILLWVLSGLLLLVNVLLYWSYLAGTGHQRAQLTAQEDEITAENAKVAHLEEEVSGLELASLNEKVIFLNEKIDQRTFSWSLLFDRVAEVLPRDVRLTRLSPTGLAGEGATEGRRGARRSLGPTDLVTLTIGGEARSGEPLLQFVDNLFAHPAFDEPDLSREGKDDDGTLTFDLKVGYRPSGLPAAATAPSSAAARTPGTSAPGAPGRGAAEMRELSPVGSPAVGQPAGAAGVPGAAPGRRLPAVPPTRARIGGAAGGGTSMAPIVPIVPIAPGTPTTVPGRALPGAVAGGQVPRVGKGAPVGTTAGTITGFQVGPRIGAVPPAGAQPVPPVPRAGSPAGPRIGSTGRQPAPPPRPALPGTSRPAASSTARLAGGGSR